MSDSSPGGGFSPSPPAPTVFDAFMYAALRATPTATDVYNDQLRATIAAYGLDPSMPVERLREDLELAKAVRLERGER